MTVGAGAGVGVGVAVGVGVGVEVPDVVFRPTIFSRMKYLVCASAGAADTMTAEAAMRADRTLFRISINPPEPPGSTSGLCANRPLL